MPRPAKLFVLRVWFDHRPNDAVISTVLHGPTRAAIRRGVLATKAVAWPAGAAFLSAVITTDVTGPLEGDVSKADTRALVWSFNACRIGETRRAKAVLTEHTTLTLRVENAEKEKRRSTVTGAGGNRGQQSGGRRGRRTSRSP